MLSRNSTVETLVKGLEGIKCTQEIVGQNESIYFGKDKEKKVLDIFKKNVLKSDEVEISVEEPRKLMKKNPRPLWGYGIKKDGKLDLKCRPDALLCYWKMKFSIDIKVINNNECDIGIVLLQGVAYPMVYDVDFSIALIYDGGRGIKHGYEWKKGDEERRIVDLFIKEYPMIIVRARSDSKTQVFHEYSPE